MTQEAEARPTPARRVASVEHATQILYLLSEHRSSLGVTDVAKRVGLSKGTVHALLSTLRAQEFVEQDSEGRYRLGFGAFEVGAAAIPGVPADGRLTPLLWSLAEDSGEAVSLAIAHRGDAVIVQRIESSSPLRAEIRIGTRMPLHSSASGKALLSRMSEDALEGLYPTSALPGVVKRTMRSRAELIAEIESVRRNGFAINKDEFVVGVTGIAVGIPPRSFRTPLAISIAGPSNRFDPAAWAQRLQDVAVEMKQLLE